MATRHDLSIMNSRSSMHFLRSGYQSTMMICTQSQPVIFADFFKPDLEEIRDFPKLTSVLNDVLDVYNVSLIAHMHVVLFLDAVQHISHLEMPRGETACSASVFINCLLTVCKQSNSTDLHILHLNKHI